MLTTLSVLARTGCVLRARLIVRSWRRNWSPTPTGLCWLDSKQIKRQTQPIGTRRRVCRDGDPRARSLQRSRWPDQGFLVVVVNRTPARCDAEGRSCGQDGTRIRLNRSTASRWDDVHLHTLTEFRISRECTVTPTSPGPPNMYLLYTCCNSVVGACLNCASSSETANRAS